jgi:tRNA-Thr(GGU) m(6)t(6)A37 methyltransferase TsaA
VNLAMKAKGSEGPFLHGLFYLGVFSVKKTARKTFRLVPIGVIRSPFKRIEECPFQGSKAGVTGEVVLEKRFLPALKDLDGVSHLYLLTFMHGADRKRLQTVTPYGPEIRGTFATRSPHRPNPIGLMVVELLKIDGCRLRVRGVDCLDSTPLIDIKPYNADIDAFPRANAGWYEKAKRQGGRKTD